MSTDHLHSESRGERVNARILNEDRGPAVRHASMADCKAQTLTNLFTAPVLLKTVLEVA